MAASIYAWVIIMIEAFRDAVWKGVLFLVCGLYALYYAIFDFEHDNKAILLILSLGGSSITGGLLGLASNGH